MLRDKNIAMLVRMAEKKLSGQDLSRLAGVSTNTVTFTLNNRTVPMPETAQRLASALDTTPEAMGWEVAQ